MKSHTRNLTIKLAKTRGVFLLENLIALLISSFCALTLITNYASLFSLNSNNQHTHLAQHYLASLLAIIKTDPSSIQTIAAQQIKNQNCLNRFCNTKQLFAEARYNWKIQLDKNFSQHKTLIELKRIKIKQNHGYIKELQIKLTLIWKTNTQLKFANYCKQYNKQVQNKQKYLQYNCLSLHSKLVIN